MSELHSVNCKQAPEENKEEYVCCAVCGGKDIEPDELAIGDLNLANIGGGYAHESCMDHEMMKEYEEALKN